AACKADLAVSKDAILDGDTQATARAISDSVVKSVLKQALVGEQLEVERIQDIVEQTLMKHGHYSVARRYIVYREDRKKARALRGETDVKGTAQAKLHLTLPDGTHKPLDPESVRR